MQDNNNAEKLVFLEFVDEAKEFFFHYHREIKKNPEKFKIITFHPVVKAWLLNRNIHSEGSFYFCPVQSHRILLTKLDEFTREIRNNCSCNDGFGIETSYVENVIFSLRSILSHWLYRVEVINNAIEHYQPNQVIAAGSASINIAYSLWIEDSERYIINILHQVCSIKNIHFINLAISIPSERRREKFLNRLKLFGKSILYRLWPERIDRSKKLIVVPLIGHNMISLISDLRKELSEEWEIVILDLPVKKAINYLWNKWIRKNVPAYSYFPFCADKGVVFTADFCQQRNSLRGKLFELIDGWSYKGVKAGWIKNKYHTVLEAELVDKTYCHAGNFMRFLNQWKPKFVLTQYARQMTAVITELCRQKDVSSLMIPHGSFTYVADQYSQLEWRENALGNVNTFCKYLALQTPLIENFLPSIPLKSQPVITGPLIFARQIKSGASAGELKHKYAPKGEVIFLYANTPKYRKSQRFFNYETIDEYVDAISAVVSAMDKLQGVHLIIRHRVIDGLGQQELRMVLPDSTHYSIAVDGSFMDYLSITDLLISYSSSTIEEALQNDIPVLIFNKYNRYQHIKGRELSSMIENIAPAAVYNVNSPEELEFGLNWILHNHLLHRDSLYYVFSQYKYKFEDRIKLSDLIQGKVKEFVDV